MGVLVDLAAWKRKKEQEAHEKELAEIKALREELDYYLEQMGPPETGPFMNDADADEFARRAISSMLATLDGYTSWPIDSSDL